jgi:hypothetical protein
MTIAGMNKGWPTKEPQNWLMVFRLPPSRVKGPEFPADSYPERFVLGGDEPYETECSTARSSISLAASLV